MAYRPALGRWQLTSAAPPPPTPGCSHLPFIQKMQAIIDPGHAIAFPPLENAALADVLRRCLDRNPRTRIPMQVCVWGGRRRSVPGLAA